MTDFAAIVQAGATAVLVCVTALYVTTTRCIANSAVAQAEATFRLAREAKAARFGGVRPVIEIERRGSSSTMGQALRDQLPTSLPYRLRNIGVGPALNLTHQVDAGDDIRRFERGAVKAGESLPELGRLPITFPTTDPSFGVAVVQYEDVYENHYESRLELSFELDRDGGWIERTALKVRQLNQPPPV
jgi:hypothetical protein